MKLNKFVTFVSIVAAVVGIASGVKAYILMPYRLAQDEAKIEELRTQQRDIEEIKVTLGRIDERIKALQEVFQNSHPVLTKP